MSFYSTTDKTEDAKSQLGRLSGLTVSKPQVQQVVLGAWAVDRTTGPPVGHRRWPGFPRLG